MQGGKGITMGLCPERSPAETEDVSGCAHGQLKYELTAPSPYALRARPSVQATGIRAGGQLATKERLPSRPRQAGGGWWEGDGEEEAKEQEHERREWMGEGRCRKKEGRKARR